MPLDVTITKDTEVEDLHALVASPGWQRFAAFCHQQWGAEGYRQHSRKIMGTLGVDNANAASVSQQMIQLEAVATQIENLVRWPVERIKKLEGRAEQPTPPGALPFRTRAGR